MGIHILDVSRFITGFALKMYFHLDLLKLVCLYIITFENGH